MSNSVKASIEHHKDSTSRGNGHAIDKSLRPSMTVSVGDYVSTCPDLSSNYRSLFDSVTAFELAFHEDKVYRYGQYLAALEAHQEDLIIPYNENNELFNDRVLENEEAFKQEKAALESMLAPIREQRSEAVKERDRIQVLFHEAEAELTAKETHIEQVKEDAKAMSFPYTTKPSKLAYALEWCARVALAGVMSLSLGVLTGAVSAYRPFAWIMLPMLIVAMAVVTLTGESVKWLSRKNTLSTLEEYREKKRIYRRWGWFLLAFCCIITVIDATLTLYGIFRAINSSTILGNSAGPASVPLYVLYSCTVAFVLPYVIFEISLGYEIAEFHHTNMAAACEAHEAVNMGAQTLSEIVDLKVIVQSLQTKLDQANQSVSDADAEIERLKSTVAVPLYIPPAGYTGQGVIAHCTLPEMDVPMKGRIHILPLLEAPTTAEIRAAMSRLDQAVGARDRAIADACDKLRLEQRNQEEKRLRLEQRKGLVSRLKEVFS